MINARNESIRTRAGHFSIAVLDFARRVRTSGAPAIALGMSCAVCAPDIAMMTMSTPQGHHGSAAYAQTQVDLSDGSQIRMGQKQSQNSKSNANDAQADQAINSVVLGQPFNEDRVSRAFKKARIQYEKQIRKIRFQYLAGNKKKHEPTLQRGLAELEQFTAAPAVEPLIEVLRGEGEEVRDWLFDHLMHRVDAPYGQATLTWLSIHDDDPELREQALTHLRGAANERSQFVIDRALRVADDAIVNNAAKAAGKFKLVEAIPLLITTQAGGSRVSTRESGGDLAFIQVAEQRFFVSDLQPVVGANSAGFDPQLSILQEGTVMAIQDAVVEFVRPDVHDALRSLVRHDYGQDVDFGYNVPEWKEWYRNEYIPYKRAQQQQERAEAGLESAGANDG